MTYYADYKHIKVKITLDYGYNSKGETLSLNYGTTINHNTRAPKQEHYDFAGWKDKKTGIAVTSFELTKTCTLRAKWTGKFYTITVGTYTLPDGTKTPEWTGRPISIQYPNEFKPNRYTVGNVFKGTLKTYNFNGWSGDKGGTNAVGAFQAEKNTTVYPIYEAQTYDVNLYGNYGRACGDPQGTSARRIVHTGKYKYWGTVKLHNDYIRLGAEFRGWRTSEPDSMARGNEYYYLDKGEGDYETYLRSVEYANDSDYQLKTPGDKNFYAVWSQNDIDIFYYKKKMGLRSYSYYAVQHMKAGQRFDPVKYPRDGLVFKAWNNSIRGNGLEYQPDHTYRGFEKIGGLYATYVYLDDRNQAWEKIVDVLSGFSEGVWSVGADTAMGLGYMVLHPFKTLTELGNLIFDLFTSDGRAQIYMAIEDSVMGEYNRFCEGELGTKAEIVGRLTGEIVLILLPASKIDKVSKTSKLNNVLKKTKAIGKFKKGTLKSAIEKEMQKAIKGTGLANSFLNGDAKAISKMSKSQLKSNLPDGWNFFENNGRIHIKDTNKHFRVRIDPPDKVTNYKHMHIFDEKGNPLDINGNIVNEKNPKAHIPWDN